MRCNITDPKAMLQNLKDAGCSEEFIETFLQAWERGATKEQLRLLSVWRCRLLDCVHTEQKKLDCLDYLRYQLQNQKKEPHS